MESIWTKTCRMPAFPSLSSDMDVDVAVVGGGMAGILIAYFLKDSGLSVAVFEKDAIGRGATAFTTAKITSQHGLIYTKLIQNIGKEKARQYAAAQQKAVTCYRSIIEQENISCHLEETSSYLYSTADAEQLKREEESAVSLGLPASFTRQTELPFPVKGAVRFDHQAQFHPLQFLRSVAAKLKVYEHSEAVRVSGHRLYIRAAGEIYTVKAGRIVIATHFPIRNFPGFYFMRQHQELSYILALDRAARLKGMYYCSDPGGYTFRSFGRFTLFGGLGHRSGKLRPGDSYRRLWHQARRMYPRAALAAHWSNEDAMPHDRLPFIGPYSLWTPQLYVATGFQKWGMTGAMTAALALSDQILGRNDGHYDIYLPQRLSLSGLGPFLADTGHTLTHLILQKPFVPYGKKRCIEKGFGPTCTHLGCTLSYNPADHTWDCPCHGSRYSEDGTLLSGPACRSLKK